MHLQVLLSTVNPAADAGIGVDADVDVAAFIIIVMIYDPRTGKRSQFQLLQLLCLTSADCDFPRPHSAPPADTRFIIELFCFDKRGLGLRFRLDAGQGLSFIQLGCSKCLEIEILQERENERGGGGGQSESNNEAVGDFYRSNNGATARQPADRRPPPVDRITSLYGARVASDRDRGVA